MSLCLSELYTNTNLPRLFKLSSHAAQTRSTAVETNIDAVQQVVRTYEDLHLELTSRIAKRDWYFFTLETYILSVYNVKLPHLLA